MSRLQEHERELAERMIITNWGGGGGGGIFFSIAA